MTQNASVIGEIVDTDNQSGQSSQEEQNLDNQLKIEVIDPDTD